MSNEQAQKEKPKAVPKWQNDFANYVTGTAFLISLSRNQISMLRHIEANKNINQWKSVSGYDNQVPTIRQLERRGLMEHNPAAKVGAELPTGVFPKWIFRLTPAGKKVLELLDLMEEANALARDSL